MKSTALTTLLAASAVALSVGAVGAAEKKYVNIGTAGIGGGYYPTGGFICNVLNKSRKKYGHKIRCTVESTGGSVANLRSIQAGEMDVAIAQSDWQFHSWNGTNKFQEDGKNEDLRFLFSLHADTVHVVANADVEGHEFKDLGDKIVNIGNVGSGTEATVITALKQYDATPESYFKQATRLTSREQAQALCDGKIDAYIYPTGITAATVTEATNTCDTKIMDWDDTPIKALVDETPYYGYVTIPGGTYKGQPDDVSTWGLVATVVASADADEEVIYYLTKSVFDNYEDFKKQSTLYVGITREASVTNGKTAPLHPGAERYFKEVGLIQ
ncbi:MAG: TAXI family TRAP transporter solute-binding subunit [Pseudomonadota bacterium]